MFKDILIFIIPYFVFFLFFALYFFQHADVHATACWRIGSYAPVNQVVVVTNRCILYDLFMYYCHPLIYT